MTINAELLEQKDLLEKQHNIIAGLEKALSQLLVDDDGEEIYETIIRGDICLLRKYQRIKKYHILVRMNVVEM